MSARDDGGPAFPRDHASDGHNGTPPRPYSAATAMQAGGTSPTGAESFTRDERAKWPYQQADAMLRAREAV